MEYFVLPHVHADIDIVHFLYLRNILDLDRKCNAFVIWLAGVLLVLGDPLWIFLDSKLVSKVAPAKALVVFRVLDFN